MRGYFYIFIAAMLMWLPSFAERYDGQTGKMLVAYKMVHGNYFENAVVYVASHSLMGATGFVLGDQFAAEAIASLDTVPEAIREAGLPIYKGGPVGLDTTFFVLEQVAVPKADEAQADNGSQKSKNKKKKADDAPQWKFYDFMAIDQGDRGAIIEKIIDSYESEDASPYMLYVGYAGWAATQLELELWRSAWLVLDALGGAMSTARLSPADAVWLDAFKEAVKNSEKKLGKIY